MSDRKWSEIRVQFDDGTTVWLNRVDFDKLESITPVLDALQSVKRMKHDLDRLLGERLEPPSREG